MPGSLIALAVLAAVPSCPDAHVRDAPRAVELASGEATIEEYRVHVVVGPQSEGGLTPLVDVTQVISLSQPHGALEVVLGSLQDDEAEIEEDEDFKAKPYDPRNWSVGCLSIKADGRAIPWKHFSSTTRRVSGTRGGFRFSLPATTRALEIHYVVAIGRDDDAWATGFIDRALASWKRPVAQFSMVIEGPDLPASHVWLSDDRKGPVPEKRKPTYSRGRLDLSVEGPPPRRFSVRWPELSCPKRACDGRPDAALENYCGYQRPCPACGTAMYSESLLAGSLERARWDSRSLQLARNWIYARHGRIFTTRWLKEYFEAQAWYCPLEASFNPDALLTSDEKAAVDELLRVEKEAEKREKRERRATP